MLWLWEHHCQLVFLDWSPLFLGSSYSPPQSQSHHQSQSIAAHSLAASVWSYASNNLADSSLPVGVRICHIDDRFSLWDIQGQLDPKCLPCTPLQLTEHRTCSISCLTGHLTAQVGSSHSPWPSPGLQVGQQSPVNMAGGSGGGGGTWRRLWKLLHSRLNHFHIEGQQSALLKYTHSQLV